MNQPHLRTAQSKHRCSGRSRCFAASRPVGHRKWGGGHKPQQSGATTCLWRRHPTKGRPATAWQLSATAGHHVAGEVVAAPNHRQESRSGLSTW